MPKLSIFLCVVAYGGASAEVPVNPIPRPALTEKLAEWMFDDGRDGWAAQNDCRVSAKGGSLNVESVGADPFFHRAVDFAGGRLLLRMRARSQTAGNGTVYWATRQSPRGEDKTCHFRLNHDGKWHEYEARFVVTGRLVDLRIDPGSAPGKFEIDWIHLAHERLHPLLVERVETSGPAIAFVVRNDSDAPVEFTAQGRGYQVDARATTQVQVPADHTKPLEAVSVQLRTRGFPAITRTVYIHNPQAQSDWVDRRLAGRLLLRVACDGTMARIERDGQILCLIGPLVTCDGKLPNLKLTEQGQTIRFQGDSIKMALSTSGNEISIAIEGQDVCTGPVVRALGGLEQGLLAGLEYLGKGESSSSMLDIETEEHVRFAPDPLKVTMPMMAFVTDRVSVAMAWGDMQLQPLFATPNFFDCTDDHRLALQGQRIDATIVVGHTPLEELILWAAKRRGLPPIPEPPRAPAEQWQLCLKALNGPLRTDAGWGHCVEERWVRQPYSDMASTLWRLTGEAPQFNELVPSGSHIHNDAIYFVTGRAKQWLAYKSQQIEGIIRRQQTDGSFRHTGKYRRGHFEDTASGVCARPAADLLEYARMTGDGKALAAGVKALNYMKRFRTPRGAQVWEVPLHTPDLLASAYLVWAYVRGFELTGDQEYLAHARKWALSGVPFVYLWSQHATMAYATPPVYGATDWKAPNWMGLPVQWVGIVYAYSLTMLAPHDSSLDWGHLARGILIAGEQMQYPDGPYAGLLPDAFELRGQRRLPARINPCSLVSLRLALDGQLDSLAVANDESHRVVSPFPVTWVDGQVHVQAKPGVRYQAVIDGQQVVDVQSQGDDVISVR